MLVTRNSGGVKATWECIAFASSGSEKTTRPSPPSGAKLVAT